MENPLPTAEPSGSFHKIANAEKLAEQPPPPPPPPIQEQPKEEQPKP